MTVAQRFSANLVRARLEADLSQEELSFRASLHRTEIGLLERGTRIPRINTLTKLAGALQVAPGNLLAGIVWEPGDPRRALRATRPGRYALSMAKRSKKPADLNRLAAAIVDAATGEASSNQTDGKDPAAVALGRKGGKKGGKARAAKMTPDERSEAARKAARARWNQ